MNALDRLLQEDLNHLLDRIAAGMPEGASEAAGDELPDLRPRLEALEIRLSELRLALLEDYDRWRSAVDECESLWALAALAAPESSAAPDLRAA